jgi:hypothetical protein
VGSRASVTKCAFDAVAIVLGVAVVGILVPATPGPRRRLPHMEVAAVQWPDKRIS